MTTSTITHSRAVAFDSVERAETARRYAQTIAILFSVSMTLEIVDDGSALIVCEGEENQNVGRIASLLRIY